MCMHTSSSLLFCPCAGRMRPDNCHDNIYTMKNKKYQHELNFEEYKKVKRVHSSSDVTWLLFNVKSMLVADS